MSDVIDITPIIKEKQEIKKINSYFDNHDQVLSVCEEVFEGGAIILEVATDGSINISSTNVGDEETIDALITAAFKIKAKIDEGKDDV